MKLRLAVLSCFFSFAFLIGFGANGASAAGISQVEGYAWSYNTGWISFNCKNTDSCATSNYGVTYDSGTGALDGYAWSSNLGWISFNAADVSGCPTAPCAPKVTGSTVDGWAKVVSGNAGDGWDGWIHLKGTNYGVTFDGTKFGGYAWSNDVMGWLSFSPTKGPGVYTLTDIDLTTGVISGGANSSVQVQSDICKTSTCVFSYEYNKVVDILATPGAGYSFVSWTGADASKCSNPTSRFCYDVQLDNSKEIRATFRGANCPSDGPAACPVCNDNEDNDGDGLRDYPADPQCSSPNDNTESDITVSACNDCIDNDGDGKIDWLDDPGCNGDPNDNNEVSAVLTTSVVTDAPTTNGKILSTPIAIDCGSDCTETFTRDEVVTLTALPTGNAVFDHWSGDCSGTSATCILTMSKSKNAVAHFATGSSIKPECSDGLDNDGDGKTDFSGGDPGCTDANDDNETDTTPKGPNCPHDGPAICPQCNDGVDNDGDNKKDFNGGDPECVDKNDDTEGIGPNCPRDGVGKCPVCYDGADNDGDGKYDYPDDPGCFNRNDSNEADPTISGNCPADGPGKCPACNDGIDNEGDGTVDWAGFDSDKDGKIDKPADKSCQGEPNKNTESGAFQEIEI